MPRRSQRIATRSQNNENNNNLAPMSEPNLPPNIPEPEPQQPEDNDIPMQSPEPPIPPNELPLRRQLPPQNLEDIGNPRRQPVVHVSRDYDWPMMGDGRELVLGALQLYNDTMGARVRARIPINVAMHVHDDQDLNHEENNIVHDGNNVVDHDAGRAALLGCVGDMIEAAYAKDIILGCLLENIVARRMRSESRSFIYHELQIEPPQLPQHLDLNNDAIAPMPAVDENNLRVNVRL